MGAYQSNDPEMMWMNNVPDIITSEMIKKLHQQYSTAYIIYRRHKWGVDCYCTNCLKRYSARNDTVIDTPLDGALLDMAISIREKAKVKCPYCGRMAIAKSAGRSRRKMWERYNMTILKSADGGETVYGICGSLFPMLDRLNPEEPKDIRINPQFDDYYVFRLRRGEIKLARWSWFSQRFTSCPAPFNPYIRSNLYDTQYFDEYPNFDDDELQNSFLKYFLPYMGISYKSVALMQIYARYPQTEMLIKAGLASVVADIANGVSYKRAINLDGQTPAEILRTDTNRAAEILRYFKQHSNLGALDKINFFRKLSKISPKIKFEFSAEMYDKYIGTGRFTYGGRTEYNNRHSIIAILKATGLTMVKLNNYIDKQIEADPSDCCHAAYFIKPVFERICGSYIDYIWQCRQLGYDLTDSIVNRPKNLEAAHGRNSDALRTIEAEKAAKAKADLLKFYQELYEKLCEKYSYTDDKYMVVVPKNADEIVAEGAAQRNCVAGYAERHIKGQTTILFLRYVSDPCKSFGTLEVKVNSMGKTYFCQAYAKRNTQLPDDAKKFLDKWLKAVNAKKKITKKSKTA